jgi:2-polyprenyl-6-methoxyphenol hydroxylase-like FAD-dependent oxidoreductase
MLLGTRAERTYAGYVAFRGTVPENELELAKVFVEKFTFFHTQGTQILGYTIPGIDGAVEPGKRLVNWVWYWNFADGTPEYEEVLTDSAGGHHRYTLPTGGKMRKEVWERQKQRAAEILPPQFAELVRKTQKPFVQAITDVEPPAQGTKIGRLLEGKAVLLGDALAGFRPHTAASTSQAAFDALHLQQAFGGKISWNEYEDLVLEYATSWQKKGVRLGTSSQFEKANGASPLQMMARD